MLAIERKLEYLGVLSVCNTNHHGIATVGCSAHHGKGSCDVHLDKIHWSG